MILTLLPEGDPFLKRATEPFTTKADPNEDRPELMHELAQNLMETMMHHRAIGLAANQCGLPYRVFVMQTSTGWRACFNPHVLNTIGEPVAMAEGCLSFPELELKVKRPPTIQVGYTDERDVDHVLTLTGLEARIFQHELDHLNGVTFDTHVGPFALKRAREKRKKRR